VPNRAVASFARRSSTLRTSCADSKWTDLEVSSRRSPGKVFGSRIMVMSDRRTVCDCGFEEAGRVPVHDSRVTSVQNSDAPRACFRRGVGRRHRSAQRGSEAEYPVRPSQGEGGISDMDGETEERKPVLRTPADGDDRLLGRELPDSGTPGSGWDESRVCQMIARTQPGRRPTA
jgi:hypothetical protein